MPTNEDHNSPMPPDSPETVPTQRFTASTEDNSESDCSIPASNAPPEIIRHGAPDGPRKRREHFDGRDPLEYDGHEAIAQFHATPKRLREFATQDALAKHFNVTRMTVSRWAQDIDVLRRIEWLSITNQIVGNAIARCEWPDIMEIAVERAKSGDIQAMKFCGTQAWPDMRQPKGSQLSNISLEEAAERSTDPPPPSWARPVVEAEDRWVPPPDVEKETLE